MDDVSVVNAAELEMVQELDTREIALLYQRLLNPGSTLGELAAELFPELAESSRKSIIGKGNVTRILSLAKSSPTLTAWLLSIRLLPLSILTLNHILTQGVKENVKVTASKELNRVAEAALKNMAAGVKVNPSSNIDKLIEGRNDDTA